MTHIAEEYKVNRLRGITQMLEMSDRQEGRTGAMDTEKDKERSAKGEPILTNSPGDEKYIEDRTEGRGARGSRKI